MLVYFLIYWLFPGVSVIALATAKEAVAQPLYILVILGGAFALLSFIYIPYNTFGEDVKMLKDSGLTTIMVLAILVGLWTASVSVADEIEGKTAVTLLSKPISRRQFMIGKFLGIVWPLFLMFVILGAILLITVSYKVVYDARETANPEPNWQQCYRSDDRHRAGPGAGVHGDGRADGDQRGDLHAAADVAEPDHLRLDLRAGPSGPLIVQSSAGQLEFVAFIGQLIAVVLPVLDHFNIQAAVAGGVDVPMAYLGWALRCTACSIRPPRCCLR